jgi:Ca2+-binding EF-hand superfamily protein
MSRRPEISDEGKQAFLNLAGTDGEIDAYELLDILNRVFTKDFNFDGFSADMTRGMVALRDYDMSGKLGFDDFKKLWGDLTLCKRGFMAMDSDGSGYFNRREFERALHALGLDVPASVQKALMLRYSDKEGNVRFDDFVSCYIKLKSMLKVFKAKDLYNEGNADFARDEYVQLCMYS